MPRIFIPTVVNTDPYDGSNSSADKAHLAVRYGLSFKRYNAVRWANMGHRRPDFQGFLTLLHFTRGTSTRSQSAPSQNPWKLRSYESILTTVGITFLLFVFVSFPAFAHSGHLGELAGHGHLVGWGLMVGAGLLAAAIGRLTKPQESEVAEDKSDDVDGEPEAT